MNTRTIRLKSRPVGMPGLQNFAFSEEFIPAIGNGELLLKTLYVSVDPYLRGKMATTHDPFEIGDPISSKVISEVLESNNENFSKGDLVIGYLDWKEYQQSNGSGLMKVDPGKAPLTAWLGVLGVTGLTAYFALSDIGRPGAGETLVVSGAAGAVGSIAGQIGKIMGCRVVGIVGTDEKKDLIKRKFGFDEAINYRVVPDMKRAIATACPDGVDIYFDNVGGEISDGVLANLNDNARVPVSGAISNYNDMEIQNGPRLLPLVVYKRLLIRGFLIADFAARFDEGRAQLLTWLNEGRINYSETIINGFDNLPQALIGLFEGRNEGKMIVKVA
jgi:NADPH-dependent curcumin reductase CurA